MKILMARWSAMGEKYKRLPHEIATGIMDPPGVKIRPAAFLLDWKAFVAHQDLERQQAEERE